MLFKIYVTENDVDVSGTYPTGYSQYARIGWCYNNAGNNLKHFVQQDRTVFCGYDDDWQVGALTLTTPNLIDLFAFIPPVACTVECMRYNGTSSNASLGVLSATDTASAANSERVGTVRNANSTAYEEQFPAICLSPYQGVFHVTSGGTDNPYISKFEW